MCLKSEVFAREKMKVFFFLTAKTVRIVKLLFKEDRKKISLCSG